MDGSVSPTWFWSSESEATPYSGLKLIHIYASVHPSSYLLSPSVSMLIPVSLLIQFSPFLLFQDIQCITSVSVLISIGNRCRVSVLMDILCQGKENTTAKGCRTFYTFIGVSSTFTKNKKFKHTFHAVTSLFNLYVDIQYNTCTLQHNAK